MCKEQISFMFRRIKMLSHSEKWWCLNFIIPQLLIEEVPKFEPPVVIPSIFIVQKVHLIIQLIIKKIRWVCVVVCKNQGTLRWFYDLLRLSNKFIAKHHFHHGIHLFNLVLWKNRMPDGCLNCLSNRLTFQVGYWITAFILLNLFATMKICYFMCNTIHFLLFYHFFDRYMVVLPELFDSWSSRRIIYFWSMSCFL